MITLTIINAPFEILPSLKSIIIGPQGGSVGRSEDGNIVVIPDPSVSRQHFRILCTQGKYCLQDTSSNGVFVNGGFLPIGNGNTIPINPGDIIKIGRTELRVASYGDIEPEVNELEPLPGFNESVRSIEKAHTSAITPETFNSDLWESTHSQLPDDTQISTAIGANIDLQHLALASPAELNIGTQSSLIDQFLGSIDSTANLTSSDNILNQLSAESSLKGIYIPDELDLLRINDRSTEKFTISHSDVFSVLKQAPSTDPAIPLGDASFLAAMLAETPSSSSMVLGASSLPSATNVNVSLSEIPTNPAQSIPEKKTQTLTQRVAIPQSGSEFQNSTTHALKTALIPLLGESANQLTEEECLKIVNEMAVSVNNVISGLMESLQSRWAFKQAMHLSMTMIQRAENNPLKFSPTSETATHTMFLHRPKGYLDPPRAMKDGIHELQIHQAAVIASVKPAMMETIRELLSVQAIESYAQQQSSSIVSFSKKGKLWDSFATRANSLLDEKKSELETLLMKKIGDHYSRLAKDLN